jgi:Holliday junction DNA helicase RuvB
MATKKTSDNLLETTVTPEEQHLFISLRASSWPEFAGQETVKRTLTIAITAAKKRKEALEHISHISLAKNSV